MIKPKRLLDSTICLTVVLGFYIVIVQTIFQIYNPEPFVEPEWGVLKWVLAILVVMGGTALYIRICYTIVDLVNRYVRVEKISSTP